MRDWDFLMRLLAAGPRENGSAELAETATRLAAYLESLGLEVHLLPFTAHPYSLRITGAVILAITLLYAYSMRRGRPLLALAVALVGPALIILEQDYQVPVFGWPGAGVEHNVEAILPVENPQRRLILAAHYDTKTDLFDHIERMPVDILSLPAIAVLLLAAAIAARQPSGNRFTRAAPWLAVLHGFAAFLVYSGGAFVGERSHGALDDGAACAMLAVLAGDLASSGELRNTEVRFLFFAGEEIGRQGATHYAAERFATPPDLPTWAVNFDPLGATDTLGVVSKEGGATRSFRPDADLIDSLERVYRDTHQRDLYRSPTGGYTDTAAFLARGIPAVTLFSKVPTWSIIPRGMHSATDRASAVDRNAVRSTLTFVSTFARRFDSSPLGLSR